MSLNSLRSVAVLTSPHRSVVRVFFKEFSSILQRAPTVRWICIFLSIGVSLCLVFKILEGHKGFVSPILILCRYLVILQREIVMVFSLPLLLLVLQNRDPKWLRERSLSFDYFSVGYSTLRSASYPSYSIGSSGNLVGHQLPISRNLYFPYFQIISSFQWWSMREHVMIGCSLDPPVSSLTLFRCFSDKLGNYPRRQRGIGSLGQVFS
jgi:hypothetical protein